MRYVSFSICIVCAETTFGLKFDESPALESLQPRRNLEHLQGLHHMHNRKGYEPTGCTLSEISYEANPEQHHPIYAIGEMSGPVRGKYELLFKEVSSSHLNNSVIRDSCANWKQSNPFFQFTSQFGQDWWLYENIFKFYPPGYRGVFVEAAAFHPVQESNSFFFEQCMGWSGLCIEPQPQNQMRFMAKRRCSLVPFCVSNKAETLTIQTFVKDYAHGSGVGTMKGAINPIFDLSKKLAGPKNYLEMDISCFPLQTFFDHYGITHIDYLSLDVESYELQAVQGIDFSRTTIDVFTIESSPGGIAAMEYLRDRDFELVRGEEFHVLSLSDYILVRKNFKGFQCGRKINYLDSFRMCSGDQFEKDKHNGRYKNCKK